MTQSLLHGGGKDLSFKGLAMQVVACYLSLAMENSVK